MYTVTNIVKDTTGPTEHVKYKLESPVKILYITDSLYNAYIGCSGDL